MQPRAKLFDRKGDAERWARDLEGELDRCGALPNTRVAESMTLAQMLTRYHDEVSPKKRSGASDIGRINGILRFVMVIDVADKQAAFGAMDYQPAPMARYFNWQDRRYGPFFRT